MSTFDTLLAPRPNHRRRRRFGRSAVIAALASIALTACGGSSDDASTEPAQTVNIIATEYAFSADGSTKITAGETVRMTLTNDGEVRHEMQVLDGSGRLIDRTAEVEPGGSDEVVITFDEAGTYQLICDIDDHLIRGQQATFIVD